LGIVGKSFRLEKPLFWAGVVPGLVLTVSHRQGRIHTAPVVELLQYKIDVAITNCWTEMVHLGRQVMPVVVNRSRAIRNLGRKRICIGWRFRNHLPDTAHEQKQKQ